MTEINALIVRRNKAFDELVTAENDLKLALDAHHGLIGKIAIDHRNRPFEITIVRYDPKNNEPYEVRGRLFKRDGTPGHVLTFGYSPFKFQEPNT